MRQARTYLMSSAVVASAVLAGVIAGPSGLAANAATHHGVTQSGDLPGNAPVTVVASGLSGPRDMVWGPDHHLLVAEAGIPPATCNGTNPATMECWGTTGLISDVSSGTPVPIVTGLGSGYEAAEVVGPDALAYVHGQLYTLEAGAPQLVPSVLPAALKAVLGKEFGALLNITNGKISVVANPGNVDYLWSGQHASLGPPDDFPDGSPYALTAKRDGGFYLVDAAAGTLDSVDRWGNVHVLAFIPNTPAGTRAVPTCLAQGPDGAVYVGQLTGFGNSATAANVYRYVPWNGSLTVWQSGFSTINGCGFGANGDFYVTELDTTGYPPAGPPAGAVIQISHDGTRTVLGDGKLFAPAGFLAGPHGSIYVASNCLIWPPGVAGSPTSNGQIVKIG
jgi:hypothetical protein